MADGRALVTGGIGVAVAVRDRWSLIGFEDEASNDAGEARRAPGACGTPQVITRAGDLVVSASARLRESYPLEKR